MDSTGEYYLLSKYDGNHHGWILRIANNLEPVIDLTRDNINNIRLQSSSNPIRVNNWSKISVTYDGTLATIYVDGQPAGSATLTGGYAGNSGPLAIGGSSWNANYGFIDGTVDEVRFYDRPLAPDEIKFALVNEWPADGNANDVAGGNPGRTTNGPVNYASGIPASSGTSQAFSFNVTSPGQQCVSVADNNQNSSLRIPTFTIEGWFQLTQAPTGSVNATGEYYLLSKYDGYGWILRIGKELQPVFN